MHVRAGASQAMRTEVMLKKVGMHDLGSERRVRPQHSLICIIGGASVDDITDRLRSVVLVFTRTDPLESFNVFVIEKERIASIDRKKETIVNPLMNSLPLYCKALPEISHGEQGVWPLDLEEAQQCSMHQRAQRSTLPLKRKAKALGSEGIAIEAASKKVYRQTHITLIGVGIAFLILGNGSQVLSQRCFPEEFSRCLWQLMFQWG